MAALFEGTTLNPLPAFSPLPGKHHSASPTSRRFDPASVTAGLAYVSRCLRGHRPFGIVTGSPGVLDSFLERITANCAAREDLHCVRVAAPTDSVQTFLADCLAQLGFELLEAAFDDLHNLFVVFLRHESTRGRRTVVIIETADQYGPRVLEFMQILSKVRAGVTPAMTFILTGSPSLHRVLDSRGMFGLQRFTRERFDLDRSLAWVATSGKTNGHQVHPPTTTSAATARSLVVMLDGAIVERRELVEGRLLIGRSALSGLRLGSRYVSRQHAALIVGPDEVVIVDLQSTNATLVNGQVTVSQRLEHGDMLAIGNFRLRYYSR